jgi:hypothetical protein
MNRSILIVIVDFLLISLLAFAKFDEVEPREQQKGQMVMPSNSTGGQQDLLTALKVSLAQERQSRENLNAELSQAKEALRSREDLLAERERRIREDQESLRLKETLTQRLDRERTALTRQYAAAQTNLTALQSRLNSTTSEAEVSKARLEAMKADLQNRQEEAVRLQQQLLELEKNRQVAESDKQRLAGQLLVAETEKRLTSEQLNFMRGEVQVVREEKQRLQEHATKLAEGVSVLAEKSGQLTQEIREYRPIAPNTIYNEFLTNRVSTRFHARRSGVFGREVNRDREANTILVSDGKQIFALYHIEDTPLALEVPGTDWEQLTGILRHETASVGMSQIAFSSIDPRIMLAPLTPDQARQIGAHVYSITPFPFRFQEAVLVGARENYYGECKFQLDPSNSQYVKMERSMFRGLFGKFSPSTGDLVFSKSGELLGLMVNSQYCAVIDSFPPSHAIRLGQDISSQQTGEMLAQLRGRIDSLPLKLQ